MASFVSVELSGAAREDIGARGKAGLLQVLHEVRRTDLRPLLPTITAPTLVVCGTRDRVNIPAAKRTASALRTAHLELVPGAGHVWNREQPELFTRMLTQFVSAQV